MRILLLTALAVLTSCIFLTGLSMPDTPRPQRHTKSQMQTAIEEQGTQDKKSSKRAKQTRDTARKAKNDSQSLEDIEIRDKHKPIDRSARTVRPSKKLR